MPLVFDQSLLEFVERCALHFSEWPELREAAHQLRALAGTAPDPFRLAIVGRMKAGKSTLINSMIGQPLAVTDVDEATATINEFHFGDLDQCGFFEVCWKDGLVEKFPLGQLAADWTGKSEEVRERVRRTENLRLFARAEKLREIIVVDTPGSSSVVEEHEAVIRAYLKESKPDAILFVIGIVRDTDKELLSLFGEGRIAPDPYNSLCALHLWDNLISTEPHESAARRAETLHQLIKEHIMAVLPVSGPLALAARCLPDETFEKMAAVARDCGDKADFHYRLSRERYWNEPPFKDIVPDNKLLPKRSFMMLMGGFVESPPAGAAEARAQCLAWSRVAELEKLLDRHFFANAMTIKQCQFLRRAGDLVEPALRWLQQRAAEETENGERADRAAEVLRDPELKRWAEQAGIRSRKASEHLSELGRCLSREWSRISLLLDSLRADLQVLRALHDPEEEFPAEHHRVIRLVCSNSHGDLPCLDEVQTLINFYRRAERTAIESGTRDMFRHLVRRLERYGVRSRS
ncbi:MAG: dynamin family protein [Verrucomicrobiales bacterium]